MLFLYVTCKHTHVFCLAGYRLLCKTWPYGFYRYFYEPRLKRRITQIAQKRQVFFLIACCDKNKSLWQSFLTCKQAFKKLDLPANMFVFFKCFRVCFIPLSHHYSRMIWVLGALQCLCLMGFIYLNSIHTGFYAFKKNQSLMLKNPFFTHQKEYIHVINGLLLLKCPIMSLGLERNQLKVVLSDHRQSLERLKDWLKTKQSYNWSLKKEGQRWVLDVVW